MELEKTNSGHRYILPKNEISLIFFHMFNQNMTQYINGFLLKLYKPNILVLFLFATKYNIVTRKAQLGANFAYFIINNKKPRLLYGEIP